ncbi:MAG: penicillin-binding protein 2 [Patescibacteria group bacterium]
MAETSGPFPVYHGERELHVNEPSGIMVQHEVMYEDALTKVRDRPVYIGFAFSRRRFVVALLFVGLVLGTLLARAAWIQTIQDEEYQRLAEANRLRSIPIWPTRGIIRDRDGVILAENTPRFQVVLTPRDLLADAGERDREISTAARILGMSMGDFAPFSHATGSARDESVIVSDRVPYAQAMAMAVALPQLPGFRLDVRPKRRYPLSTEIPSLSHILGYVGTLSEEEYATRRGTGYRHADEIGKTGIERSYEPALRGTVGERLTEVDARNRVKGYAGETPANNGEEIQLALDVDLQRSAEEALREALQKAKVTRGAVVAMDPRDGSILAAVSLPAYDNNAFAGGVSSTVYQALIGNNDRPLFARAWAGAYPSGSTVKIVVSAAALSEGIINANTTIISSGGLRIGAWFFPDWKPGGHGVVNVRKAIAQSVNTFYYMVGGGYESFVGLGATRLSNWMKKFGLGERTGLDVPSEASGHVPSPAWREERGEEWYVGDTYNLSIGQGDLLVTPMQVAAYTSSIANGGYRIQPHFFKNATTTSHDRLADAGVIQTVQQGMREGVLSGSSRALASLPFQAAGKTGTAQWNKDKNTHAWHTAYAPYDRPEIVVTVLLEEGGEGSSTAIPVSRQVLDAWWKLRK